MAQTEISIIVPAFNSEKTIQQCIDSILNSNTENYEIIVVDDKSTDDTRNILKSYLKNKRIKLIFHKKNKGITITCNEGALIASGKYIVILASDVIVKRDCIAKLLLPMGKNSSIGMTQGSLINAFSNEIETVGHFLTIFGFPYELSGKQYKNNKRPIRILGSRAVTACRAEIYKTIGGYDEDYVFHGEDTDFSWRVSLAGYKIYYIPQSKAYHHHIKSEKKGIAHYLFYEGPKNQISNIIKNAPSHILVIMLSLNLFIWFGLSLKCFVTGRPSYALGIYRGIFWNIRHLSKTLQKRSKILSFKSHNNDTEKIMFGPIGLKQYVNKGLSWLNNV